MNHKTKSRIAFFVSGILLAAFLILGGLYLSMGESAAPSPSGEKSKSVVVDDDGFPEVDWDYWLSINPDIVGWVTVPDTNIDYPIVQAPADDPDYYLHHDVYQKYNIYGCPYLDAECAETGLLGSRNAVVFGHHMNNGTMFSAFADYSGKSFAKEHETILMQTPDGAKVRYAVGCVQIVKGTDSKITSFPNTATYHDWYQKQVDNACVVLDDTCPVTNIMFVTCSYHYWSNERTLVLAHPDVLVSGTLPVTSDSQFEKHG